MWSCLILLHIILNVSCVPVKECHIYIVVVRKISQLVKADKYRLVCLTYMYVAMFIYDMILLIHRTVLEFFSYRPSLAQMQTFCACLTYMVLSGLKDVILMMMKIRCYK